MSGTSWGEPSRNFLKIVTCPPLRESKYVSVAERQWSTWSALHERFSRIAFSLPYTFFFFFFYFFSFLFFLFLFLPFIFFSFFFLPLIPCQEAFEYYRGTDSSSITCTLFRMQLLPSLDKSILESSTPSPPLPTLVPPVILFPSYR